MTRPAARRATRLAWAASFAARLGVRALPRAERLAARSAARVAQRAATARAREEGSDGGLACEALPDVAGAMGLPAAFVSCNGRQEGQGGAKRRRRR
jgi:hypothetical protein